MSLDYIFHVSTPNSLDDLFQALRFDLVTVTYYYDQKIHFPFSFRF